MQRHNCLPVEIWIVGDKAMMTLVNYGESAIFIILLLASVLALAVGIERTIVYWRHTRRKSALLMEGVVNNLRANNIEGAMASAAEDDCVYGSFSGFALSHYNEGHEGLLELMEGRIIGEKILLEKRLTILNTLGNNAPFIGLLGTVLGVIKAFYGLGTLGNAGAEVVMRSISSALMATAAGLFVAIPVVMANNYFTRKMKVILQNLDILAKEFLAAHNHSKSAARGASHATVQKEKHVNVPLREQQVRKEDQPWE
jgi:biopolymer transport protein ExbB